MHRGFSIAGHPLHPALVALPIGRLPRVPMANTADPAGAGRPTWYDVSCGTGIAAAAGVQEDESTTAGAAPTAVPMPHAAVAGLPGRPRRLRGKPAFRGHRALIADDAGHARHDLHPAPRPRP